MYIKKISHTKKKLNVFFPFLVKCLILNKILFDLFVQFSFFVLKFFHALKNDIDLSKTFS
jgi:hypothetical protein